MKLAISRFSIAIVIILSCCLFQTVRGQSAADVDNFSGPAARLYIDFGRVFLTDDVAQFNIPDRFWSPKVALGISFMKYFFVDGGVGLHFIKDLNPITFIGEDVDTGEILSFESKIRSYRWSVETGASLPLIWNRRLETIIGYDSWHARRRIELKGEYTCVNCDPEDWSTTFPFEGGAYFKFRLTLNKPFVDGPRDALAYRGFLYLSFVYHLQNPYASTAAMLGVGINFRGQPKRSELQ